MSDDLIQLKGLLFDMPKEQQETIKAISETIRELVKGNGENGLIGFSLAALEFAEEIGQISLAI